MISIQVIWKLVAVLLSGCLICAARPLDVEEFHGRLRAAWQKRDYEAMERHIQAALASAPEQRPVILASCLYLYVFSQPNYEKVQASVDELEAFVAKHGTQEDLAHLGVLLKELKAMPKEEYAPLTQDQRETFHKLFPEFFFHPFLVPFMEKLSGAPSLKDKVLPRLKLVNLEDLALECARLMKESPPDEMVDFPKERWPATIASLRPKFLRKYPDGIAIMFHRFLSRECGLFVCPPSYVPKDAPNAGYEKIRDGLFWYWISG